MCQAYRTDQSRTGSGASAYWKDIRSQEALKAVEGGLLSSQTRLSVIHLPLASALSYRVLVYTMPRNGTSRSTPQYLPMANPGLITLTILSFQGFWNELEHFIIARNEPNL